MVCSQHPLFLIFSASAWAYGWPLPRTLNIGFPCLKHTAVSEQTRASTNSAKSRGQMQLPAPAGAGCVPAPTVSVVKEHEEKIKQLQQDVLKQKASMDQDLQAKLEQRRKKKQSLRGTVNVETAAEIPFPGSSQHRQEGDDAK